MSRLAFAGVNWQFPDLSLAYESSGPRLVIRGFGLLRFTPEHGVSTQGVAGLKQKKPLVLLQRLRLFWTCLITPERHSKTKSVCVQVIFQK
jgi:hypothetical protein